MKKLRSIRKIKNLSQAKLARISKVSQSMICDIENEKINPSVKIIKRLASALEVSVAELLEEEESKEENREDSKKLRETFYFHQLSIAN